MIYRHAACWVYYCMNAMKSHNPAQDRQLAESLQAWESGAWDEFRVRFESRILFIAVRWCGPACRADCPGYRLPVRYSPKLEIVCDTALEAFYFIIRKVVDKLKYYRGECSLETWLHPMLTPGGSYSNLQVYDYRKLFADYLREERGRVEPPASIKHLSNNHQKLFVKLVQGYSKESIAEDLRISLEDLDRLAEELDADLRSHDWNRYWETLWGSRVEKRTLLFNDIVDDGEGGTSIDPADERVHIAGGALANICLSIIRDSIKEQNSIDKILLSLRYDVHPSLEASEIAEFITLAGIKEMDSRERIYVRLRTIRGRIARRLKESFDDVNIGESAIDGILDEWGTGIPQLADAFIKKIRAQERKCDPKAASDINTFTHGDRAVENLGGRK